MTSADSPPLLLFETRESLAFASPEQKPHPSLDRFPQRTLRKVLYKYIVCLLREHFGVRCQTFFFFPLKPFFSPSNL